VLVDLVELLLLTTRSRSALAAENLFLRKQLAMFQERSVRPHRAQDSARWLIVVRVNTDPPEMIGVTFPLIS